MSEPVQATQTAAVLVRKGRHRIAKGNANARRLADDEYMMTLKAGDRFDSSSPIVKQLPELFR